MRTGTRRGTRTATRTATGIRGRGHGDVEGDREALIGLGQEAVVEGRVGEDLDGALVGLKLEESHVAFAALRTELVVRQHLVAGVALVGHAREVARAVAEHVPVQHQHERVLAHQLLPELLAVVHPAGGVVLVRVEVLRMREIGDVVAEIVVVQIGVGHEDTVPVGVVRHDLVGPGDDLVPRAPLERQHDVVAPPGREQMKGVLEPARLIGAPERRPGGRARVGEVLVEQGVARARRSARTEIVVPRRDRVGHHAFEQAHGLGGALPFERGVLIDDVPEVQHVGDLQALDIRHDPAHLGEIDPRIAERVVLGVGQEREREGAGREAWLAGGGQRAGSPTGVALAVVSAGPPSRCPRARIAIGPR